MYPLTLVRISRNKYISFTFKNGSRGRAFLKKCDLFMNLHVINMTYEDINGNAVYYKESYIRGTSIKYVNVNTELK